MKGVVFTEFQEMIEGQFGLEMYDRLIEASELPSGGAYTAVGTYDHSELLQLVTRLSFETGSDVPDLVRAFGVHLFSQFSVANPQFLDGLETSVDFLRSVEDYIHVEVRKLYPDAELPKFKFEQVADGRWEMIYQSSRPFADLAHGLIAATIEHFGDAIDLERIDEPEVSGTSARFILTSRERAPVCS